MRTDPDVVFYINGFVALQTLIALLDIKGVNGGIKTAIGPYKDVVAENDGGAVEHDASLVDKDVIAKRNIAPVIDHKGREDGAITPNAPQKSTQERIALIGFGGMQMIVLITQVLGLIDQAAKFGICGRIVPMPAQGFFSFCH